MAALQLPQVQRSIAQMLMTSLSKKTHSRIEIGSVSIAFTNSVVLHDIFIESRKQDTLVYVHTLAADVNLLGLLSRNIDVKKLKVEFLTAHITRTFPDSSFNFDFLLDALQSDSTASVNHADTSARAAWTFRLEEIDLKDIHSSYDDEVGGLHLFLQLGTLKASIDKFDVKRVQFHVNELSLANTRASVIQSKTSPPGDSSPSSPSKLDVGVGALALEQIHFKYENTVTGERIGVDLGKSTLLAKKVDLPGHHIAVKNFMLDNTSVVIAESEGNQKSDDTSQTIVPPWIVSLDQLTLNGNSVEYDVENLAKTNGVDWNHLRINSLTMRAEHLYYSKYRMTADFSRASFRERSGLDLREMSGGFMFDAVHAQLKDFILETAESRIHQNVLLGYVSIDSLANLSPAVTVNATIDDSRIAVSDLLLVLPSLPLRNGPGAAIRLSSKLSGLLGDLNVEDLRLAAGDSTAIELSGSILGLPNVETANYVVNLQLLSTTRSDIHAIVADSLLPKDIIVPESVRISGTFNGTPQDFAASTDVGTSIGSLKGNVTLNTDESSDSTMSRWKGNVVADEFDVGSLLDDQSTFGPASLTASFAGTGLSKDDIEAQVDVQVDDAMINGYSYHGLAFRGTASPNMFDGTAEIQDSSIDFVFSGTINTSQEDPTYKFTLDLNGADLGRLNLTSDDIRVAGNLTSDISGNDINDIIGTIKIRNLVIIKDTKRSVIDSVVFSSINNQGKKHVSIASPILSGELDGTIVPGDVPEVVKQQIAGYLKRSGIQARKDVNAQDFTFHFTVRDPTTLSDIFVPELRRLSIATVHGNYISDKQSLNVNIDVPRLDYSDFTIDSLAIRVTSDADFIQATISSSSIADSLIRISNLQLTGKAGHDSIDVALQTTGSNGSVKMLLAGVFSPVPDGYKFRFNKDGIVLQNSPWDIAPDNYLLLGSNYVIAHNVELHGAGQSLLLRSVDEKSHRSPLKIEFGEFELSTLSRIVERDTALLGGRLNGNVALLYLDKRTAFTSDLTIEDFSFGQRHVGDVTLRANNQTENTYNLTMDVTGNGNQIGVRGQYRSQAGGSQLDITCDFSKVNLASIEAFTFGNVRRLSGTMTGGLHLTGTTKKPSVSGELNFANTAFEPTFLDTYLHLDNGKVAIDGRGVEFKSFDLVDTLGNVASLSGHLYTEDFRSYSFDLRAHTNKFLLLSKPASRDALYYGTIFLNSDVSIKGDQNRPIITVQAELAKGTNLTLALPESELAIEERRGIVRFVDFSHPPNAIMSRRKSGIEKDTTKSKFSTIDLTSNITVNKDSKLRILIDPVSGDSLVIHGDATLSFSMDPSGKLTLTGRYEIVEGSYQLSFGDFIKRAFVIDKGSSLTWLGSPYDADVDITAIYTVNASVLDLIQNELAGTSQEERNKYKQEVPIQVYLMMKGKLLSPDIHFRLDMPPDQRGVLNGSVYAKLNELNGQESELNKQVFALLVLGRFISESTIASASGNSGLSDLARSSVSQILSAQLNRLSQQYIAGATLNVGVESYQDYSTGNAEGRTQLQLALSKQLFDERVTVQVGGNVDLEGRRSQQNSLNSFAGDLKVQYKLTEDGRWQLEVFRQNSYEGAIDGDITKTGVGAVFTIDFDRLFGLTMRPSPEKEKK